MSRNQKEPNQTQHKRNRPSHVTGDDAFCIDFSEQHPIDKSKSRASSQAATDDKNERDDGIGEEGERVGGGDDAVAKDEHEQALILDLLISR